MSLLLYKYDLALIPAKSAVLSQHSNAFGAKCLRLLRSPAVGHLSGNWTHWFVGTDSTRTLYAGIFIAQ